jgi:large subunit ribosomal protein L15
MLQLNNLFDIPGSRKSPSRVGRGAGSGLGKTAGKGHKGQKARKGVSIRWFEGGQTSLVKRLPKRGFKSLNKIESVLVNFSDITHMIRSGIIKVDDIIDAALLKKVGFIKKSCSLRLKLLSGGDFDKKMTFKLDSYSKSARSKVESLGGECC